MPLEITATSTRSDMIAKGRGRFRLTCAEGTFSFAMIRSTDSGGWKSAYWARIEANGFLGEEVATDCLPITSVIRDPQFLPSITAAINAFESAQAPPV